MILHALLTEKKRICKLEVWFFIYPRRPPLPPGLAKDHTFFRFFFGPLLLQWDEVKMEGRGEGVWNECDDSWEWIQWKYRCLQTKPRKVHLQLFQVRKKQIEFFYLLSCFYFLLFYCMSTVHEEGHDDQQCKIDWTLLIKSTFYLHFKLGMTTNYRVATGVDNIDY